MEKHRVVYEKEFFDEFDLWKRTSVSEFGKQLDHISKIKVLAGKIQVLLIKELEERK